MATHIIAANEIAKHQITLTAGVMDTVTFEDTDVSVLEIQSDGAAAVYYTLDGSVPAVDGPNCLRIPPALSVEELEPEVGAAIGGQTVVKLISSGTPTLSVIKRR